MAHTVDATAALRTHIRAQIVALRLQGLTLGALVHLGSLTPKQAGGLVRDAARFLAKDTNDPEIQSLYADTLESIASDLEAGRPAGTS